jgi:ABC-2 family transporter protein
MNARRIGAILTKDLRDALRDGRIVLLLLLPIGLAVFYNSTTPDEDELPETTVVVVDEQRLGVADRLREAASDSVEVEMLSAGDAREARRIVDADDAAFAVVASAPGEAEVLLPENASPTAQSVVALVPAAVQESPSAGVSISPLPVSAADQRPADVLEQRTILVVVCVVMLLSFVALLVVPIQTAEELGTGTFGALRLAATGPEILAAKAICGLLYAVAGTVLTMLITGAAPADPVAFYAAAFALAVSLVGFGLLLGMLSGNANQINTYGGFMILPVIVVATAVLIVDSGVLEVVLDLLPFSAGAQLLFDGVSAERPFDTAALSWLVLAAWTVAGFAVLTRVANRREV